MYTKQTIVVNKSGLHARPANEFVQKAKVFQSKIMIRHLGFSDAEPVNAKSIVRLLSAGFGQGTPVEIMADGCDEEQAANELAMLIESGFGEE